jgi:hypothetical protein
MNTTERELLEKCLSPLRVELRHGLWFLESEEFTGVQKALAQSDVDTLKSVIKDIEAYLAKPQVETLKPLSVVYRWTALKDGKLIYQYSDQGYPEIFKQSVVTLPTEPEQAKPAQDPVAWCVRRENGSLQYVTLKRGVDISSTYEPLYLSPQSREPMSEDDIELLANEDKFWSDSFSHRIFHWFEFARAIEAHHGIK